MKAGENQQIEDTKEMIRAGKQALKKSYAIKPWFTDLFIGLSTNKLIDIFFNYFLYPYAIYSLGVLVGGFVMTFLSFIVCFLILKFYDWSKRDWLGIEAIKKLKKYDGDKKIGRLTAYVMKKGDPAVFLFLSVQYDPFITTVYLRRGQYNGMNRRDWMIFIGSLLFGNAYWTLACYMGISLFEWGWKAICG